VAQVLTCVRRAYFVLPAAYQPSRVNTCKRADQDHLCEVQVAQVLTCVRRAYSVLPAVHQPSRVNTFKSGRFTVTLMVW